MTLRKLTLVLATAALLSAQADVALQRAIRTETIEGDLKGAIEQYGKLVEGSDRAIAAQALIRMAGCHEKLGTAQARQIYERVVDEFADQADAVAVARAHLDSDTQRQAQGDRVVWSGPEMYGDGRVSPDGRFISYTDYHETGNLLVYDTTTGTHRPLTGNRDWSTGSSAASAFSSDGKQLAYAWRTFRTPSTPQHINELRIVSLERTGIPQPRRVFGNEEVEVVYPTDWSLDGRWIAVVLDRRDRSKQIGLVGVQDGSYRGLRTVGWRGPDKMFFSPDGKYLAYDLPAGDRDTQRDVFVLAVNGSGETRVVEEAAHDLVMGWSPDGGQLLFTSDRNGPRGLWALPVSDGKPVGEPLLLKPGIGAATSLGLTSSGALYIMKDTSTSRLQLVPVDLDAGKVAGPPVIENYVETARPDWSRDGNYLAYASVGSSGIRTLFIRSLQSGELRELRPPLGYYVSPRWMPDGDSLMMFARDLNGRTGIYRVDAQTGDALLVTDSNDSTRVNVSPDGKKIYYHLDKYVQYGEGRGPGKYVERDLASGDIRVVFQDPFGGPQLSPDGRYLTRDFNDEGDSVIALEPVSGGEPRELFRVPDIQGAFNGGHFWTPDGRAVIAAGKAGFWLIPVGGGQARKLDIDLSSISGISPDGRHIATNAGESLREVWALENFLPKQTVSR